MIMYQLQWIRTSGATLPLNQDRHDQLLKSSLLVSTVCKRVGSVRASGPEQAFSQIHLSYNRG
jgi:hypothetical protein